MGYFVLKDNKSVHWSNQLVIMLLFAFMYGLFYFTCFFKLAVFQFAPSFGQQLNDLSILKGKLYGVNLPFFFNFSNLLLHQIVISVDNFFVVTEFMAHFAKKELFIIDGQKITLVESL